MAHRFLPMASKPGRSDVHPIETIIQKMATVALGRWRTGVFACIG
jgi:hypothetical protein